MAEKNPIKPSNFPDTVWDDLQKAGDNPEVLHRLLVTYRPVMVAHLVHKFSIQHDSAEDHVQDFVAQRILQRDLLNKVDPDRGQFRQFLKTCLNRFYIDKTRKRKLPESVDEGVLRDLATAPEESDAFDTAWALQILATCFRRTKYQCEKKQRPELWGVFEGRILAHVHGYAPIPFQQLADRFGFASSKQAANALVSVQLMVGRNLAAVIGKYHTDEPGSELRDLQHILRNAGPKLLEELRHRLWDALPDVTLTFSGTPKVNTDEIALMLGLGECARRDKDLAENDLKSTLQFVLNTPLQMDLFQWEVPADESLSGWTNIHGMLQRSLADVLFQTPPVPDLLISIKNFAKEQRKDPQSLLPREVSTLIYYLAIGVAFSRVNNQISRHDAPTLRRGFQWGIDVDWVDDRSRQVFANCLEVLEESDRETAH